MSTLATNYVGQTAPYRAANGHLMVAPMIQPRSGGSPRAVHAWAWCTDDCRACGSPEQDDYCGERWDEGY